MEKKLILYLVQHAVSQIIPTVIPINFLTHLHSFKALSLTALKSYLVFSSFHHAKPANQNWPIKHSHPLVSLIHQSRLLSHLKFENRLVLFQSFVSNHFLYQMRLWLDQSLILRPLYQMRLWLEQSFTKRPLNQIRFCLDQSFTS